MIVIRWGERPNAPWVGTELTCQRCKTVATFSEDDDIKPRFKNNPVHYEALCPLCERRTEWMTLLPKKETQP